MEATPREQLLLAAVQGSLSQLIDTAGRLLGCPLLLGDTLLNVLAWTGGAEGAGRTWDDFIAAGRAPDFQTGPEGPGAARPLPHGFVATPIPNRVRGGWDTLVDLDLGQGLAAHLVISDLPAPPTPEADELVGVLCLSIRGLLRAGRDAPFQSLSADQFLLQLLHEEEMDESLLRFRASLVGLEPEGQFALLLVDLRDYRPVRASISTVCAALRQAADGPYAIDRETLVLLVRPGPAGPRWEAVEGLMKQHGLQGVYSLWFYRLADAGRYYRRTARALALRRCAPTVKALYPAEELAVYQLADLLLRTEGRLSVDQPILVRLAQSDQTGKTAYLETLFTYLACARHPAAACAQLHIHRNTLDYRLRRMEELAHIDWNDGDLLFRLYFSLCLLRCQQMGEPLRPL